MISISYDLTVHYSGAKDGEVSASRNVLSAEPEKALAEDVHAMLRSWRPEEPGDMLRLALREAWHVHLGVHTFPCRGRLLRRAADRIWPVDPGTGLRSSDAPVEARLAHHLLAHGEAVARMSPFVGLVASRN